MLSSYDIASYASEALAIGWAFLTIICLGFSVAFPQLTFFGISSFLLLGIFFGILTIYNANAAIKAAKAGAMYLKLLKKQNKG
jgi:hypothetical protein